MKLDYHGMAMDLLNLGIGDEDRLRFILEGIAKNKPLYKTDMKFLESMTSQLELKIQRLRINTSKSTKQKEKYPQTLLSDEHLDRHLDKMSDRNSKIIKEYPIIQKNLFLQDFFLDDFNSYNIAN